MGGQMERMKSLLIITGLLVVVLSSAPGHVQAELLPPARVDGFVYPGHRADSSLVMVEAFFDPVCSDTRDSWPDLKLALKHYGSRVGLVVHLLPLPYHDNAFATSRALHIVNMRNSSDTFKLLEWFFGHQERFYNAQTYNKSRAEVVDEIVKSAADALGDSYRFALQSGFDNRETDLATRVSFKYSASRGVYGTPTFYVNGFALPDAGSPIDYGGWRKVIDPLVRAQGVKREDAFHSLV